MVKEEFKDIGLHDGGGLNLIVIRDTQSSRKIDLSGLRGIIFLDLWFQRCSIVINISSHKLKERASGEELDALSLFLKFLPLLNVKRQKY